MSIRPVEENRVQVQETTAEQNSFTCIPKELMLHIFSFLPSRALVCAGATCRSWYPLAHDPLLWKQICIRENVELVGTNYRQSYSQACQRVERVKREDWVYESCEIPCDEISDIYDFVSTLEYDVFLGCYQHGLCVVVSHKGVEKSYQISRFSKDMLVFSQSLQVDERQVCIFVGSDDPDEVSKPGLYVCRFQLREGFSSLVVLYFPSLPEQPINQLIWHEGKIYATYIDGSIRIFRVENLPSDQQYVVCIPLGVEYTLTEEGKYFFPHSLPIEKEWKGGIERPNFIEHTPAGLLVGDVDVGCFQLWDLDRASCQREISIGKQKVEMKLHRQFYVDGHRLYISETDSSEHIYSIDLHTGKKISHVQINPISSSYSPQVYRYTFCALDHLLFCCYAREGWTRFGSWEKETTQLIYDLQKNRYIQTEVLYSNQDCCQQIMRVSRDKFSMLDVRRVGTHNQQFFYTWKFK